MIKKLGIIFSFFVVFNVYSANKFTIESTKFFPNKKEQKQSDLSRAQDLFIANIVKEQGESSFFKSEISSSFLNFKNQFKDNKQKISFVYDSMLVSLNLDILDKVSDKDIINIFNRVRKSTDFLRYSQRRNIKSVLITVDKLSLTVFLSNGESDEGTVFSIDITK